MSPDGPPTSGPPDTGRKRSTGRSAVLLMVLLLAVGLVGTWVLGPVGAPNILLGAACVILTFVGLQWLVFSALGLRSAADDQDDDETPSAGTRDDARAWRG